MCSLCPVCLIYNEKPFDFLIFFYSCNDISKLMFVIFQIMFPNYLLCLDLGIPHLPYLHIGCYTALHSSEISIENSLTVCTTWKDNNVLCTMQPHPVSVRLLPLLYRTVCQMWPHSLKKTDQCVGFFLIIEIRKLTAGF